MSDCIQIGPDEVHIWRARLDVSPAVLGGAMNDVLEFPETATAG